MEPFTIEVYKYGTKNLYRIRCYITHRSEQVIRFRLCAGNRSMTIEKQTPAGKQPKWQVTDKNFQVYRHEHDHQMTFACIVRSLELYLRGPIQPRDRRHPGDYDH